MGMNDISSLYISKYHNVHTDTYILYSKIPDCTHLIEAAKKRGLMVMGVVAKPNDGSNPLTSIYPTAEALLEVGMHQVYEPPMGSKFDIVECAVSIQHSSNVCYLFVVVDN